MKNVQTCQMLRLLPNVVCASGQFQSWFFSVELCSRVASGMLLLLCSQQLSVFLVLLPSDTGKDALKQLGSEGAG